MDKKYIELYDVYTHRTMRRRDFLDRLPEMACSRPLEFWKKHLAAKPAPNPSEQARADSKPKT